MSVKDIAGLARASFASALMFLAGAIMPLVGGLIMVFAPAPLLGYAVGRSRSLFRICLATVLSAGLIAIGGGVAAATAYLASFGLAAGSICFMLERRQPFELIVLVVTTLLVFAGTATALAVAGSPSALVQMIQDQLHAGIIRGQGFYKSLGVNAAITPDTQAYIIDTGIRLAPVLLSLMAALMVLLNLAVFWRWSGKEQRLGYILFGDMARWSAPEWLIWPLLVTGFGWFIPMPPVAIVALDFFLCIVAVYFCQGLAIMAFYFRQLRMPLAARALIYFVTLAQPLLMAIVGAAGIFDLWVDFRRLKRPNAAARNLGNFL